MQHPVLEAWHPASTSSSAMSNSPAWPEAFYGFGIRVWGLGFRDWGEGFRVKGLWFSVQSSGFRVQGLGFRVQDLERTVKGEGIMD